MIFCFMWIFSIQINFINIWLMTLYPANICWSSRRLEDAFKTCPEDVFNTTSAWQFFVFQDGLEDVLRIRLEDAFKKSWKTKNIYTENVLKTSWRQTKCLLGISVSNIGLLTNLIQYLTNIYLTNLYFTNLRQIRNALFRTQ